MLVHPESAQHRAGPPVHDRQQNSMGATTSRIKQHDSFLTPPPSLEEWVQPVTVQDVWEATAGISPRELFREFGWSMATGSMQRMDRERQQDLAELEVQQSMPAAIQMGDFETANKIKESAYEAHEVPEEQRVYFNPPAPPPVPEGAV